MLNLVIKRAQERSRGSKYLLHFIRVKVSAWAYMVIYTKYTIILSTYDEYMIYMVDDYTHHVKYSALIDTFAHTRPAMPWLSLDCITTINILIDAWISTAHTVGHSCVLQTGLWRRRTKYDQTMGAKATQSSQWASETLFCDIENESKLIAIVQ